MENASKALIIAGAIIISILLIGLGVGIYNMAAGQAKSANIDSEAAQAQNSKFEDSFGPRQSAAEVKSLMSKVRSNNITGKTNEDTTTIYVFFKGGDGAYKSALKCADPAAIAKEVKPGRTYNIDVANSNACELADESKGMDELKESDPAYYQTGYIRIIQITENDNTSSAPGT